jgi:hypothetical protein
METLVHNTGSTTRPLRHPRPPRVSYSSDHPTDECPACQSVEMRRIANEVIENYLCAACGRCWSLSSAGVTLVNPMSCTGCDRHDVCVEEFRKELAARCSPPNAK